MAAGLVCQSLVVMVGAGRRVAEPGMGLEPATAPPCCPFTPTPMHPVLSCPELGTSRDLRAAQYRIPQGGWPSKLGAGWETHTLCTLTYTMHPGPNAFPLTCRDSHQLQGGPVHRGLFGEYK